MTVGLLCLLSTVLNLVFLFKSRPVRYYVKNEKGEEEEMESEGEEDDRGLLGNATGKWKRDRAGKRSNVVYTAANTEETVN